MADAAVEAPVAATPGKKGGKAAAAKKPKAKPTHPKTSEMVNRAIGELKERGGSSLQAIKKYITANYKVDADKLAPFIKRYLKGAVESGALVRTKGKGAAGSFRLEGKTKAAAAPKKRASSAKKPAEKGVKKGRVTKKKVAPKKPAAAAKPKKAVAAKKKVAASPAKKPKSPKPKSPSKAKKTAKPPTKKPKSPKPKKAAAAKKPAAKKAAAKK